jgi:ABC-type multidrug transport system ATPase subunit
VVVILSTHIVEDVADLCPRMATLAAGRIVGEGEPQQLIDSLTGRIWRKLLAKGELEACSAAHQVISTRLQAGRTQVHVLADAPPGEGFEPARAGLEDVYFATLAATRAAA